MILSMFMIQDTEHKKSMLQFEFEKTKNNIIQEISRNSNDIFIDIDENDELIENTHVDQVVSENINTLYGQLDHILFPINNWSITSCFTQCFRGIFATRIE